MQNNTKIIILLICIASIGIGTFFGNRLGLNSGKEIGYQNGFDEGRVKGEKDMRVIMETALKGAAVLFVDKLNSTKIPYQKAIHGLDSLQSPTYIKNTVKLISNDVNKVIIERFSDFGDFSISQKKDLITNYEKYENLLSDSIYQLYHAQIKLDNARRIDTRNLIEKAESYSSSLSKGLCFMLDNFSPHQRFMIAESILKEGKKRSKNSDLLITNYAISYVEEHLCNFLLENSFEFVSKLFIEYAQLIDFTEGYLIGEQGSEKVMKLVSSEITTTSNRKRIFVRDWAIDPKYTIRTTSKVLAGINLEKFYQVEFIRKELSSSGKTKILITVPNPEILAVHPIIKPYSEYDINIIGNLRDEEMTLLFDEEIIIAKKQAEGKGIIEKARENARHAFKLLYSPLILNSEENYEIIIEFDDTLFADESKLLLG